jgi:hypothetical protein
MGGLALKHIEGIRRYSKDEFFKLADEMIPRIKSCLNTDAKLVISYHKKESFGDMDIIVLNDGNLGDIRSKIREEFNPTDMHFNGNVYSFDHKDLQIDIIITPTSNFETSQIFFSYNDLGNLMGKVFHKFGLKYGFDGLKYIYRLDNDKKLADITITKDMRKAFEFLGLSYERYEQGFDTVEDIFDFVIGSPYFQKESFYFENLNAINKKRNIRRANYKLFIEYVNGTGTYEGKEPLPDTGYKFNPDKSEYLEMINDYFPESNLLEKMKTILQKEKRKMAIAEKFNGHILMERYGLIGKELGNAISLFKSRYTDFGTYILGTDSDKIYQDFEADMNLLGIDLSNK